MWDSTNHFGILAENSLQQISIFDTDTLTVIQSIPLGAELYDVALTRDCQRVVITSYEGKTFFQIDLSGKYGELIGRYTVDTFLEDVDLTPDGRFAVSVDGGAENQNIVSYSLEQNIVVSSLPAEAQAVAISPTCNGLVLASIEKNQSVRRYEINNTGQLFNSEQEILVGQLPINIIFNQDGNYAFVLDFTGYITVLSTIIPHEINIISTLPTIDNPNCMAISKNSKHFFILGKDSVSIYDFDPIAGHLAYLRSFQHGLQITPYYGVDQITLDQSESRLFISAVGQLAVFTTYGTRLGTVNGVEGPGGIAICSCMPAYRPYCYHTNRYH